LPQGAARVVQRAAGLLDLAVLLIPVGRPLPDVAGHLVQTVAVRWKRSDRGGPFVAVDTQVLPRKLPLPGIGHRLTPGRELLAPAELGTVQPAACCEFPFGFGR